MWMSESAGVRAFSAGSTALNQENTGLLAEGASCKK